MCTMILTIIATGMLGLGACSPGTDQNSQNWVTVPDERPGPLGVTQLDLNSAQAEPARAAGRVSITGRLVDKYGIQPNELSTDPYTSIYDCMAGGYHSKWPDGTEEFTYPGDPNDGVGFDIVERVDWAHIDMACGAAGFLPVERAGRVRRVVTLP